MTTLQEQWQKLVGLEPDDYQVEEFQQYLRLIVCRDYGWLASELFELEGELGWGPGIREYDGEFFPPPTESSSALMQTFLNTLTKVKKDTELRQLIYNATVGNCKDRQTTMLALSLHAAQTKRTSVVQHLYNCIAQRHSAYTLGAARLYSSLWTQQEKYALSLAGLIRLLYKPLNRLASRAETVRRKTTYIPETSTRVAEPLPMMLACV